MSDPTRLSFHLVQFAVAGRGRHWIDFEPVELGARSIVWVRAGQVHWFDPDSEHEALLLFFTTAAFRSAFARGIRRWQSGTLLRPSQRDFGVLVELLRAQLSLDRHAEELSPERVGRHLLDAVLAGIASVIDERLAHRGDCTAREELLMQFEDALDEQFAAHRTVSWYATRLGTSTRTLGRACVGARNYAPKQLIDMRVALEAKRMLVTTSETVESIARKLRFSEPTNFVKFFRRITGSTPDAFRRSYAT